MINTKYNILKSLKRIACLIMLLLAMKQYGYAQPVTKAYKIKNGKMYIMLDKQLPTASLDSFVNDFNLEDLQLKKILNTGNTDSLVKAGWSIELNNANMIALSKKLDGVENIDKSTTSIVISGDLKVGHGNFPSSNTEVKYGINKFKNKNLFTINDSVVTFFLRNNSMANKVILAGSFNDWSETALEMKKVDVGWIADVKLAPGKYWYKFIIDGRWEIDRDNKLVENDGKGNDNSVYYKPNYIFRSHHFLDSKQLFVAGSFNDWAEKDIPLIKTSNGWVGAVYLAEGTHTYRFVADGRWNEDPENSNRFLNEFGAYNSVVQIGKQHLFMLDGFANAVKVTLLGSFNKWRDDELQMKKVNGKWELPYSLGPGNYQYTFKVDDNWVDKATGNTLTNDANRAIYYNLILEPNYTFRLKGFADAKNIFLAGDFNNWSPNTYPLTRTGDEWIINIHVDKGKHLYKYVVDGKWILDPGNNLWEQNEYQNGNSVLWIEK